MGNGSEMYEDPAGSGGLRNLLDGPGFNGLIRGRYGYLLYNKNDSYVGKSVEQYGEYGQFEAAVLEQICKQGDVAVEVGANIGTLTLALARAVGNAGRVYAFEPQRVVFQTLCANMALNSLTNVECFHAAVGAQAGHVLIPDIRYDMKANFGAVRADAFDNGAAVPKVTLDEFLHVNRLKLLKVDVEGMEREVLLGASKLIERFRPILYVENDRADKSPDLIRLIQSMRYRLFWHLPHLYNPQNFAGNQHNVFSRNLSSLNMLCVAEETRMDIRGLREVAGADDFPPVRGRKPGP